MSIQPPDVRIPLHLCPGSETSIYQSAHMWVLVDSLHRCLHAGPSGAERDFDDDEDSAKGMARLFVEVGEAYLSLIITATQEVRVRGQMGSERLVGQHPV